jgi:hypothetical protein
MLGWCGPLGASGGGIHPASLLGMFSRQFGEVHAFSWVPNWHMVEHSHCGLPMEPHPVLCGDGR